MGTLSLFRRRSLFTAAVLAVLVYAAGCASSGKTAGSTVDDTGPHPTGGSGVAGADDGMAIHACTAPASSPRGTCGGCSVNCGDKEAYCRVGEEWPTGGPACQTMAVCQCR